MVISIFFFRLSRKDSTLKLNPIEEDSIMPASQTAIILVTNWDICTKIALPNAWHRVGLIANTLLGHSCLDQTKELESID